MPISPGAVARAIFAFLQFVAILLMLRFLERKSGRNAAYGLLGASTLAVSVLAWPGVAESQAGSMMLVVLVLFLAVYREEARRVIGKSGLALRRLLGRSVVRDHTDARVVDEVATAIEWLAAINAGALIVFENEDPLDDIAVTGHALDAEVSASLIETIFASRGSLHDGALLIRASRLYSAGVVLPLSKNHAVLPHAGTRHRAALGISERCDASVLVLSEERGEVRLARNGEFVLLEADHIRRDLHSLLTGGGDQAAEAAALKVGLLAGQRFARRRR